MDVSGLCAQQALEKVGLLDERFFMYAEDIDWCNRFWKANWKVALYPKAQVIHYGGASSANAPIRFSIEMRRADLLYWKKYHHLASEILYGAIWLLHDFVRIFGHTAYIIAMAPRRKSEIFKIKRSIHCMLFTIQMLLTQCFRKIL